MAITIQDSGATDIDYVRKSFELEEAVTRRGRLKFEHIGTSPPLDWGEDVYVYDGATKIWGGTVESITQIDLTNGTADTITYRYDCIDFSQLAGRLVHVAAYESQTAGAIMTTLAGTSDFTGIGCSAGTIDDGAQIEAITFNYLPYEMIFDELAEISGYYWTINKDRQLDFRPIDTNVAPFDLTASNKPYHRIAFAEQRGNYVNEVYVRAGTRTEDTTVQEVQFGDTTKTVFVVGQPIGSAPTVEIDTGSGYVSQTVAVDGIGSAQWYYTIGSPIVRHDTGETRLTATDKVRITFNSRYPIIVRAIDDDAKTARAAAETGSGKYVKIIDATDIESSDEAQQKATAHLDRYSAARLTVSYSTDTSGIEAGMSQLINLSAHGVNARFLIEQVSMRLLQDGTPRYQIEGAATQTVAGWSYWKQKTRQDRKFVQRSNEILDELRTPKDNMTLSDAEPTYNTYAGAYTVNGADTYINGFHVG